MLRPRGPQKILVKRADPVCDFCSVQRPTIRYPAPDIMLVQIAGFSQREETYSRAGWTACETCAQIIADDDSISKLADHVFSTMMRSHPLLVDAPTNVRAFLFPSLVDLYSRLLPLLGSAEPYFPEPLDGCITVQEADVVSEPLSQEHN